MPTLGADWVVVLVLKIVASWCSAARRSLLSLAKGAAGDGFRSASIKSIADLMTVLVEDKRGMGHCSGKNSTVSLMRSDAVLVV